MVQILDQVLMHVVVIDANRTRDFLERLVETINSASSRSPWRWPALVAAQERTMLGADIVGGNSLACPGHCQRSSETERT